MTRQGARRSRVAWLRSRMDLRRSYSLQLHDDKMRDELGEALDVGIAELDRGQGIESSIDEFMAEIDVAVGR